MSALPKSMTLDERDLCERAQVRAFDADARWVRLHHTNAAGVASRGHHLVRSDFLTSLVRAAYRWRITSDERRFFLTREDAQAAADALNGVRARQRANGFDVTVEDSTVVEVSDG